MARVTFAIDVERVRASLAQVREEVAAAAVRSGRSAADVALLAATKYVTVGDMPKLAEAGVRLVGENRAQDLDAKAKAHGELFTWHFIGRLQSRRVPLIVPHVQMIHSVASESALRVLERHAGEARHDLRILIEVNVAGEQGKAGVLARRDRRAHLALAGARRGPDDDAAGDARSRSRAGAGSPRCGSSRTSADWPSSRWGPARTTSSRSRREPRSCGSARAFTANIAVDRRARWAGIERVAAKTAPKMAIRDSWHRALVYFGLAEEYPEELYEDEPVEAELESHYRDRPNVRRLRRRRDEIDDIFAEDDAESGSRGRAATALRPVGGGRGNGDVRVHLVVPKSFNDAQQVADKFKEGVPVILNLQGTETELAKRLIDFASGLTYALDGGMQRIADKVFMLTPRNVEISAEERARLIEKGFFNQA